LRHGQSGQSTQVHNNVILDLYPVRGRQEQNFREDVYRKGEFSMNKPAGTSWKVETTRLKMKSPGKAIQNRRLAYTAAACALAVVVGGCGGGGDGGSSPGSNPAFVYPPLADAVILSADSGVTSNYSLQATSPKLELDGTSTVGVSFNSPSLQSLTIAVTGLGTENPFSFTVNDPAASGPLTNSPLVDCSDCLRERPGVPAPNNQSVRFIYLNPASAAASFSYSTLGLWNKTVASSVDEVGAAFSIGVVTRSQDLPFFGNPITYKGFMVGRYADGSNTYVVAANATAVVTFSVVGSIATFTTNNTYIESGGSPNPAANAALDLTSPAALVFSFVGNSANFLVGTLSGGGMTGPVNAKYYGPPTGVGAPPAELGGAFFVGDGSHQMNGSFALKRQ
jgi:hypothetical protein